MKANEQPLSSYLQKYQGVEDLTKLDELWTAKDADGNGYLDKAEAQKFIEELQTHMKEDRKENYK